MTCPHVSLPTGLVPLQGPTGGQGVPVCAGCEGAVRERLEAVVGGMSQRRPGGQRKAVPERTG